MAQIDKLFTAIWHNTTTWPGTPLTGLSATITIRDKITNTIVVNNEAMTEIGLGEYDYTFTTMDGTKPYSYVMNPNSTSAYIVSGFVDPRMAKLDTNISDIMWWRWAGVLNWVTTSINGLKKSITDKIDKIPQVDLSEIKSHIDVAKDDILNKIEDIEIPEAILEEKEAKKAIKLIQNVDKKLTGYIDTEMKEKEQLGAIAREFNRLELEDSMKEKEKEMEHKKMMEEKAKMEAEQDQKLLEEIKKEFDLQEEQEKEEKRKELEKELEEIEKEKKEIEKELKSI